MNVCECIYVHVYVNICVCECEFLCLYVCVFMCLITNYLLPAEHLHLTGHTGLSQTQDKIREGHFCVFALSSTALKFLQHPLQ